MNPFDSKAADWDDNPGRVENARKIASAIRNAVPLSNRMSAMEFGCGTGLVSREIFPMVGNIVAIDLSPGMIEQLQKRIKEAGIKNITVCCQDIINNPLTEKFDLLFSAMALHHIPDTAATLDTFIDRLAPGGWLALADLDTEDGSFHGEDAGPVHPGFNRETLIQELRNRGMTQPAAVTANILHKNGRSYPVFLITACRPSK